MKKVSFLVLLIASAIFAVVADGFATPYTFDSDNQGWVSFDITLNGSTESVPVSGSDAAWDTEADGNGYIYLKATSNLRPRPYSIGTTSGFDNWGDLNGKKLIADFKRMGDIFQTMAGSNPTIKWVIADTDTVQYGVGTWYVSKLDVSPLLNDLTDEWTTYSMEMTADNFFLWPHGVNAIGGTPAPFEEVLSTYKYVGFTLFSSASDDSGFPGHYYNNIWSYPDYGAYSTGTNSIFAVDNIKAAPVPEPATIILMGIGVIGLVGIKTSMKKS